MELVRTTAMELVLDVIMNEQDWCVRIMQKLVQPSSTMVARGLKEFAVQRRTPQSR